MAYEFSFAGSVRLWSIIVLPKACLNGGAVEMKYSVRIAGEAQLISQKVKEPKGGRFANEDCNEVN